KTSRRLRSDHQECGRMPDERRHHRAYQSLPFRRTMCRQKLPPLQDSGEMFGSEKIHPGRRAQADGRGQPGRVHGADGRFRTGVANAARGLRQRSRIEITSAGAQAGLTAQGLNSKSALKNRWYAWRLSGYASFMRTLPSLKEMTRAYQRS